MLDASKVGRSTKILARLAVDSLEIRLPTGQGPHYRPTEGDHYYATLVDGQRREIVQVTGGAGDRLWIRRAQDGTDSQVWAAGTCLLVEWNAQQLREFIQQTVEGPEPVLEPGTYCLDCTTCIEIDSFGRIVRVDGAEQC